MPSVPWNHCFHFLKSKPLRRLPPPPLPRVPPLSLGHLVVVAMETTSKMACKSTRQEQREMREMRPPEEWGQLEMPPPKAPLE